jgi:hypothetical protein
VLRRAFLKLLGLGALGAAAPKAVGPVKVSHAQAAALLKAGRKGVAAGGYTVNLSPSYVFDTLPDGRARRTWRTLYPGVGGPPPGVPPGFVRVRTEDEWVLKGWRRKCVVDEELPRGDVT